MVSSSSIRLNCPQVIQDNFSSLSHNCKSKEGLSNNLRDLWSNEHFRHQSRSFSALKQIAKQIHSPLSDAQIPNIIRLAKNAGLLPKSENCKTISDVIQGIAKHRFPQEEIPQDNPVKAVDKMVVLAREQFNKEFPAESGSYLLFQPQQEDTSIQFERSPKIDAVLLQNTLQPSKGTSWLRTALKVVVVIGSLLAISSVINMIRQERINAAMEDAKNELLKILPSVCKEAVLNHSITKPDGTILSMGRYLIKGWEAVVAKDTNPVLITCPVLLQHSNCSEIMNDAVLFKHNYEPIRGTISQNVKINPFMQIHIDRQLKHRKLRDGTEPGKRDIIFKSIVTCEDPARKTANETKGTAKKAKA